MVTAIYANWHAWESGKHVVLSDEDAKKLYYFRTWDDAINWLYLNDHKDAARAINKQIKS